MDTELSTPKPLLQEGFLPNSWGSCQHTVLSGRPFWNLLEPAERAGSGIHPIWCTSETDCSSGMEGYRAACIKPEPSLCPVLLLPSLFAQCNHQCHSPVNLLHSKAPSLHFCSQGTLPTPRMAAPVPGLHPQSRQQVKEVGEKAVIFL